MNTNQAASSQLPASRPSGRFIAFRSERRGQLRHDLEEVGDETVVGNLENRRFRSFADRHDHLRILHAGQMLDGAGDADGDIELRGDDLAGLADLIVVGTKPARRPLHARHRAPPSLSASGSSRAW